MSQPNDEMTARNPVEEMAEEFLHRFRRGERPSVTEYAERHPDLAGEIRDVFGTLLVVERLSPNPQELSAAEQAFESDGRIPSRLGDFRILRKVGRGGMGIVYEAEQESLGRHVALKVLPSVSMLHERALERFRREARAAAHLHHSNIVSVFGVGEENGLHYYAMQFIHGKGLDEVLAEVRQFRDATDHGHNKQDLEKSTTKDTTAPQAAPINSLSRDTLPHVPVGESQSVSHPEHSPTDDASIRNMDTMAKSSASTVSFGSVPGAISYFRSVARIAFQIADALAYAHDQGVVHRDIKPSNLLLDPHGTVWVTDFGLAKMDTDSTLTHTGDIAGTLRYLAPERFSGSSDSRSDIYALGLTLYEMLTLRPAFDETDRGQLIKQITGGSPTRPRKMDPRIPADLETIVLKAAATEPADRYQTAAELADELRRFLEDVPIRAKRTHVVEHARRWCRKNPGVAWVTVAAGLIFLAGFAATFWQWRRAEANLTEKESQRQFAQTNATEATNQRQLAQQQADRAERFYQLARQAVDDLLISVSEEERLLKPELEPFRKELLSRALAYYQNEIVIQSEDPTADAKRALLLIQIGTIKVNTGPTHEAIAAFEQAIQLLDPVVRAQPQVTQYQESLIDALNSLGLQLQNNGGHAEAQRCYERSIHLAETLMKKDPQSKRGQHVMARSLNNFGYLMSEVAPGSTVERNKLALTYHKRALDIYEQLEREHPGQYQINIANVSSNMSTRGQALNNAEEALNWAKRSLVIRQELARKGPKSVSNQRQLAGAHNKVGDCYRAFQKQLPDAFEQACTNYQESLRIQEDLLRQRPTDAISLRDVGTSLSDLTKLYLQAARHKQALDYCQRSRDARERWWRYDPLNTEAAASLAATEFIRSQLLERMERYDESIQAAEKAIGHGATAVELAPKAKRYKRELGEYQQHLEHLRYGKDQEIARLTKLIDANPKDWGSFYNRGLVQDQFNEPELAEVDFRQALPLIHLKCERDGWDEFRRRAVVYTYRRLGKHEKSLVAATEGIAQFPESPYLFLRRAEAHYALRNYERSFADASLALKYDPHYIYALWVQAEVYRVQQDYNGATHTLRKVLEIEPENHDALNQLAWYLAIGPIEARNSAESLKLCDLAYDRAQRPHYLNTRAAAFLAAGEYERGLQTAQEAQRQLQEKNLTFGWPLNWLLQAICLERLGKHDEALAQFDASLNWLERPGQYYPVWLQESLLLKAEAQSVLGL